MGGAGRSTLASASSVARPATTQTSNLNDPQSILLLRMLTMGLHGPAFEAGGTSSGIARKIGE